MKVMHYHEEGHSDASQAARPMKQVMHYRQKENERSDASSSHQKNG